jgi:hypothetical protein
MIYKQEIPKPKGKCRPQMVKHIPLGNKCLADEFPHTYGCLCSDCDAIWKRLVDEDKMSMKGWTLENRK